MYFPNDNFMKCLAYILGYIPPSPPPHFYHRIRQNIFYSLVYIGKCNKCYQLAYLALLYSESDAFYYLEMTWKTHTNHIVNKHINHSFGYSNSWILARIVTPKLILLLASLHLIACVFRWSDIYLIC